MGRDVPRGWGLALPKVITHCGRDDKVDPGGGCEGTIYNPLNKEGISQVARICGGETHGYSVKFEIAVDRVSNRIP